MKAPHIKIVLTLLFGLLCNTILTNGQALQKDFPSIYPKFQSELANAGADFIMVVDNSSSMQKYSPVVKASINTFISSIPSHDYVSLILFDQLASNPANDVGFASNASQNRNTLINTLNNIPFTGQYTDLGNMIESLERELKRPGGNTIKFVFVFTDFFDQPSQASRFPVNGIDYWIQKFKKDFKPISKNNFLRVYPISLPLGNHVNQHLGYFQQLFSPEEFKRPINNISEPAALTLFFNRINDEINREKLKILVHDYCDKNAAVLNGQLEFDGKLRTTIKWDPKGIFVKLNFLGFDFPISNLNIDGVKTVDRGINEIVFKIKSHLPWLPQIRKISGNISAHFLVECCYAKEFEILGSPGKYTYTNKIAVNRTVFLHFFPFWLDLVLLVFILLWSACAIYTLLRKTTRSWTVSVSIKMQGAGTKSMSEVFQQIDTFTIGRDLRQNSPNHFQVPNAKWCIRIETRNNCPCKLWKNAGYYLVFEEGNFAEVEYPYDNEIVVLGCGNQLFLSLPGMFRGGKIFVKQDNVEYKISLD